MGEPITVREYDKIVCNESYKGVPGYECIGEKEFDELKRFIHEFTGDVETTDVLEFMQIGYKRHIGEFISIKNYVGLIQTKKKGKVNIYILPYDNNTVISTNRKAEEVIVSVVFSK